MESGDIPASYVSLPEATFLGRRVSPQDWFGKVPRLGLAAERGWNEYVRRLLGNVKVGWFSYCFREQAKVEC